MTHMTLTPDELSLLVETRDLARSTAQTLDESVIPALYGNGGPGLRERVESLEHEVTLSRGRFQGARWVLMFLSALGGAGGGLAAGLLTG